MMALERVVVGGSKLGLPHVGLIAAHRGHTIVLQSRCGVRWRIVVLLGVRQVYTHISLQLQVVDDLPLGKGIGNDTRIGRIRLNVIQVADRVAHYDLTVTYKHILTDGGLQVIIGPVAIVDRLCGRCDEGRHPAVGSPFGSLAGVAVIDIAQSCQTVVGT